ncbi:GntR family transcriptional regulator [bacterium]|nr:MAG: GntR family transcriptional regulator [bacterium]
MRRINSTSRPRLGRPAVQQDLIVQEIRDQIVAGELLPGSRLPTRESISQKYGAGANTVQRAIDKLRDDGFILSNGRNGTHVSPEPPHLTRYALVFPSVPSDSQWVRFWTALNNEAISVQRNQGRTLAIYYGVSRDHGSNDYLALQQDVLDHRVAGIIFATPPFGVLNTPVLDEPGIPRISIMAESDEVKLPRITPDINSFFDQAIKFLHERGCRKIAFLNPSGLENTPSQCAELLAAKGMMTQPFWNQIVHLSLPHTAQNLVQLLMHVTQNERPDGLIIGDDNLVEYATAGLVAAGVRVPDDIQVVAHCNFPWPTPSVVPVRRLGYDARQVLQTAIDYVDAMRRGEPVPQATPIYARFEDELL